MNEGLGLFLIRCFLLDLVAEALSDAFMAFLSSFLNIDLRSNLNFLVIATWGVAEVAELLPKLGKIALLFFLLALLWHLWQATLILLLGNLGFLLGLHLVNYLAN